jgi:PAS domain S-box-containing protein
MNEVRYDEMSREVLVERLIKAEERLNARRKRDPAIKADAGKRRAKKNSERKKSPAPSSVSTASESDFTVVDSDGRIRKLYTVVKDVRDDAGQPVFSEGALYEVNAFPSEARDISGYDHPNVKEGLDQTELLCRFRPDGTLTYVNEAYCRYFGCNKEDLHDRNVLLSISEADREKVFSRLKELRPDRPVDTLECRVVTLFGDILWNQWTYRVLYDEKGNVLEYQSVGRDITFRKYTQEILEKRAAILEAVTFAAEGFLKSASWMDQIDRVLERFGAATNAPHVFLCENRIGEEGNIAVHRSYEWLDPQLRTAGDRHQFMRNSALAVRFSKWVYEKSEGRPIYGTIGQFPDREVADLALDKKISIAMVPILIGERWWGFIGFADYSGNLQWSDEELAPLEAASEILGTAIEKEEKERILGESHARIREQERFLSNVFDSIQDGLVVLDKNLNVVRTNPVIENWPVSYRPIVGSRCHRSIYGRENPCEDCPALETLRTGEKAYRIRPVDLPDGPGWFEVFTYPRRDEMTGELTGAIEYVRDITERKKAEEALRFSEARYRELSDHLPVGVYEQTLDGRVSYANSTAMKMFGYNAEDVQRGVNLLAVICPEEHEAAIRNTRSVREGTPLVYQEYTMLRKDGRRFPALTMVRPLIREGRVVGSTGVVTDISDIKEAQEALRKNEALLGSVLRAAPIGVGVVQGRLLGWMNEGMTQMMGYEADELRGKSSRILYPDDEEFEKAGQEKYARILAVGQGAVETRWKRKDGTVIDVHLSSAPIEPNNLAAGVVFTAMDITAQKQAANILKFAKEDLEKQVSEQTDALSLTNMLLRIELEEHRKTEEALATNEQLYRGIVEDQTELICRFLPDGTLSFVNEAYCRYFGKNRDAILGQRHRPRILREDMHILEKAFRSVTPDHPVFHVEFRTEIPDGTIHWLHWTNRAIFDHAGLIVEHQGVGRDVTDRKHSEQRIQESRNMLRSIFDGMTDPLVMVNGDLTVIMANQAALALFGEEHYKNLIGYTCHGMLVTRYGLEHTKAMVTAVSRRHPSRFDLSANLDVVKFEEVFIYPVRSSVDKDSLAIIRITDRTGQRIMEKELEQREKLASLGLLIAGIVHEINNPNNFIVFNLPILRDYLQEIIPYADDYAAKTPGLVLFGMPYPDFREDVFKLLGNIEHGSVRINATVAKLKEFSRKKENKGLRSVRPSENIEKAVAICHTQIRKTVKSFEVDVERDMPEMTTDPDALEQVLINLLINAAQAADKDDSFIRLRAFRGNSWKDRLIFEVADNGCGMDEKVRSKIFTPFFTTKHEGLGTGLGLYISKNLIEGVGGRMVVESEKGCGTTFRISIPDMAHRDSRDLSTEEQGVAA